MKQTKIEWADSTVNPVAGCDGCELWNGVNKTCYAGVLTERYKKNPGYPEEFTKPKMFPGRMAEAACWSDLTARKRRGKPWLAGLPRMIFVSDMGDALSRRIDFDYLAREIIDVAVSREGVRHNWLWLTKRPDRMAEFSAWLEARGVQWPKNLWPMTSVTTQGKANSRVPQLLKVGGPDTIRGLSVEPLWEPVSLKKWLPELRWVIVGGESGPARKVMDLAWARSIRDECRAVEVPFFFKQMGGPSYDKGGGLDAIPRGLRIREVPRRARPMQIREAGRTYRTAWERVPIRRELAEKLEVLAKRKGQTRREFLDWYLSRNLAVGD